MSNITNDIVNCFFGPFSGECLIKQSDSEKRDVSKTFQFFFLVRFWIVVYILSNNVSSADYSIKAVSKRTGLSLHVIRVWEKRYGAVRPKRTATNRRLYSDPEIERLTFLRLATAAGHGIGNIARLPLARLKSLVAKSDPSGQNGNAEKVAVAPAQRFCESCLAAARGLDAPGLEKSLEKALVALGHQGLLRQVVAPLAQTIGELWRAGVATAAHEHFLTAGLKVFLGQLAGQFAMPANAPRIIVATPAGQLHELGALIVHAAAAQVGWHTTYLGPSLPAAEIAGAAVQNRALAVALSIVYPEDDPNLPREITNLRRFLPTETRIFVGGRAGSAYRKAVKSAGALFTNSIDELCTQLDDLRRATKRKRA
jgi:DNA-binding transcriptional MerR regulator/methylmalonyl-CoA mutase cobalamin-binding subunit